MKLTLEQQKELINEYYDWLIKGEEPIFNFKKEGMIIYSTNDLKLFLNALERLNYEEVTVTPF